MGCNTRQGKTHPTQTTQNKSPRAIPTNPETVHFISRIAACEAARRAIGTRNGEQLT